MAAVEIAIAAGGVAALLMVGGYGTGGSNLGKIAKKYQNAINQIALEDAAGLDSVEECYARDGVIKVKDSSAVEQSGKFHKALGVQFQAAADESAAATIIFNPTGEVASGTAAGTTPDAVGAGIAELAKEWSAAASGGGVPTMHAELVLDQDLPDSMAVLKLVASAFKCYEWTGAGDSFAVWLGGIVSDTSPPPTLTYPKYGVVINPLTGDTL